MAGRFSIRRFAAPEPPAIEQPAPAAPGGAAWTALPEVPAAGTAGAAAGRRQSAAQRQVA